MNLVFCGTPQFAVPTLEKLVKSGLQVSLVVTQPDRMRGRGLELTSSPVKHWALSFGLPIVQPDKIKNNEDLRSQLTQLHPDAIVVVGYGRIIPEWMIKLPKFGNINLHASLLPKYRGAAPIQWAIAMGERVTGVTTMRIDAGLDTGDILLQREVAISESDTSVTLAPRLAMVGAELMADTLNGLQGGTIKPRPQDDSHASLAPILKREDGLIDFRRTATETLNRLKGFQPWPGAYTFFRGKTLQVHDAGVAEIVPGSPGGSIVIENERLLVVCGQNTALELLEVQPEGKKRMATRDFVHGYRPRTGEQFKSSRD
jgi:methionyl-tRNA formyltransferase